MQSKTASVKQMIIFLTSSFLIAGFLAFIAAESYAKYLYKKDKEMSKGKIPYIVHKDLGWVVKPGKYTRQTHEFLANYNINKDGFNDRQFENSINRSKKRIMVVGDSHTFATGVSTNETWPNVLEKKLFNGNLDSGTVYNLAIEGYSLGQYLTTIRNFSEKLKPEIIIIGFSMATDVYDLIPPDSGGFIFGPKYSRIYFDLNENGDLIKKVGSSDKKGLGIESNNSSKNKEIKFEQKISFYKKSYLYKRLKRSRLAAWVAARFKIGGKPLWPGMSAVLSNNLSSKEKYQWTLAEKILEKISIEVKEKDIQLILVTIPYLPQVYDDLWESTFGSINNRYDRFIGLEILSEICKKNEIYFIDTTKRLINEFRKRGGWLHFKEDAHPTKEGQEIIADEVLLRLHDKF